MRAVFLTSLLLCPSSLVCAQPWGPWTIAELPAGSALHSPKICLRNSDTADVFYQIGDTVFHLTADVTSGSIAAAPTAFPMEGSGWSRRLCDVVATSEGWAALVYDTTPHVHRTLLLAGRDSIVNSRQISSGVFWDGDMTHSGSRDYGFALARCDGGGCIAGWQNAWIYYNQWPPPGWSEAGVGVAMYVSAANWPHPPFMENANIGCWSSTGGVQTALHRATDDTVWILQVCGDYIRILHAPGPWGYEIALVRDLGCRVQLVGSLFARGGGILLLSHLFDSSPSRLLRIDSLSSCSEVQTLDDEPIAAASDPDFGIAWLAWHGPAILLYRADTTGAEYLPEGTVHWPDQNRVIAEAAVGMSQGGRIAAVWSERVPGSADATLLRMKSLNWETPLAARDRAFILPPSSFILSAYPNPFNSTLKIEYTLPQTGNVEVSVFNVLGQKVETLVGARVESGTHAVTWNPKCAGGVYFITMKTETAARTTKVLYLR